MRLKLLLWVLVLATALVQIVVTHHHRDLLHIWQKQDAKRQYLQEEHTKLVLELSTLSAHSRIDREARKRLNMVEPKQVQVLR